MIPKNPFSFPVRQPSQPPRFGMAVALDEAKDTATPDDLAEIRRVFVERVMATDPEGYVLLVPRNQFLPPFDAGNLGRDLAEALPAMGDGYDIYTFTGDERAQALEAKAQYSLDHFDLQAGTIKPPTPRKFRQRIAELTQVPLQPD